MGLDFFHTQEKKKLFQGEAFVQLTMFLILVFIYKHTIAEEKCFSYYLSL